MQFIFSNQSFEESNQLGGKASNLIRLCNIGMNVPAFAVIPADFLVNLLPENIDDPKQFISNYSFETGVFDEIKNYIFTSENSWAAVRSSGVDEDGGQHSFAGQFETELFVDQNDLENAIRKVWLSAFDTRVLAYRKSNGLTNQSGIAIIIQQMIDSEIAGVAFGINPITGNRNQFVVSSVYGLGEGLVSGVLDADTYQLKSDGEIIDQTIAIKTQKIRMKQGGGTELVIVDENLQTKSSLNQSQLERLANAISTIYKHLNYYPDIEFAFNKDELYLLQSRPVTSVNQLPDTDGKKIVWDNSNIIESYPGLTSPLTFSFIVKMYEAVYRQLSIVMGVDAKKVDTYSEIYANMLGLLNGRVYYNLNSWYGALQLLPGYSLNAGFMEKMMGVKESFDSGLIIEKKGWRDYWDIAKAIKKILYNLRTSNQQRIEFQSHFNKVMAEYENMDFQSFSPNKLMEVYLEFEQTLVKKWKAPLVNDFFAMIFFGLLQKQCAKLFPENQVMHNDLVSGAKDIITTEPIELSFEIVQKILTNSEAKTLFETKSPLEIWKNIKESQFEEIGKLIKNYIYRWGDRSVGELKLETLTYHQHPEWYVAILKSYVLQGITKMVAGKTNLRADAEHLVRTQLAGKPIKKWVFNYILGKARYFVSNRENLRYERTRGFGMVRNIFLAMAQKLFAEQVITNPRDIFWLTQNEVFDFIKGTSVNTDLKSLISLRKKEYDSFENLPTAERIVTYGMVYSGNNFKPIIQTQTSEGLLLLKGLGCCAGIVKAKVRVVHHPSEVPGLEGDILVTSSTDPGWVTLFPTCSGILVERGSLLSHSAIVSREMGIPCIVGITGLLQQLKTGDEVEMNGSTGEVKLL